MEILQLFLAAMAVFGLSLFIFRAAYRCWVLPNIVYRKLRANGFGGPTPCFPLGNINEMIKSKMAAYSSPALQSANITNDIHPIAFPYFSQWKKLHGKVFIYWLGIEPFLYIADPVFLSKMSAGVLGKTWGKPNVFKKDRRPMFGNGLVMVEGEDWVHHRHVITPAFAPSNLKAMSSLMVESANNMLDRWGAMVKHSGKSIPVEVDVEKEIINTAAEIIAKTSFGISYENGGKVFEKLRAMQITLFQSNRYVGVPFSKLLCPKQTMTAKKLGKEIDSLLTEIINTRRSRPNGGAGRDLLGLLLAENHADGRLGKTLTTRELVDEC